MAGELLLDTGALVSLLDRSQSTHRSFTTFFEAWLGPVLTTEAVLTEASHLLGRLPMGRRVCLDFVLCGGATLVPTNMESVARCRQLIEQYADLPMDYADATLVTLAEEVGTDLVFTTDRRDFLIYRPGAFSSFRILPDC